MNPKSSSVNDFRPPNQPWRPLPESPVNHATITFYFSDSNSETVPVRDISCQGDPKRDPNFETQTYGLFSECCKDERRSIAEKGLAIQFFCTSRANNTRVLTGYYLPSWYCSMGKRDYAIAAKAARFVSPGFVLSDLVDYLAGYPINKFFRRWKYLPKDVANRLLFLLDSTPNAMSQYLSEIKTLEQYALKKNGSVYRNRTNGFNWDEATELLKKQCQS